MSLDEMYKKIFGPDHNEDVPTTQGYDQYLSAAEYEQQTQKAIEESVREMPRGRGGPVIREGQEDRNPPFLTNRIEEQNQIFRMNLWMNLQKLLIFN
ncbi:unnamed protein product [Meloidogyne enterolobii]|uniref:Uncharacterized protein n=1 Tax=Meloidogyne enterolobii TaxID=390850 RepID=A0ACB1AZ03_MELEN